MFISLLKSIVSGNLVKIGIAIGNLINRNLFIITTPFGYVYILVLARLIKNEHESRHMW